MSSARVTLTVSGMIDRDKEYVFAEPRRCVVGRADDCDIQIPPDLLHADVSRHHCAVDIATDPPHVRVRDLGSLNGTWVNGKKIGQRQTDGKTGDPDTGQLMEHELRDGDEIRVGNTTLQVAIQARKEGLAAVLAPFFSR